MSDLAEAYAEFWEDLLRDADASGEPQLACFFESYAPLAAENGDCGDLTYTPVRKDGATGYQVDGYAIDREGGELHIAISDFRAERELESLNQARIESLFKRAERFVNAALKSEFVNSLEETSPTFQAAQPIYTLRNSIKRVRLIIFSNARLVSRKKGVEAKEVDGRAFTYNLLDFTRYVDIRESQNGSEPIEIDFSELGEEPLQCIQAHTGGGVYASYLIAMPGELLAKIYGLYGPRLLEQNVRTFLQARTKVNRGIIETISQTPEMFFAYNNGLTATASELNTARLPDGSNTISRIKNLQIVNGGQTTASILYAKDQNNADLRDVYVQVKLSVVEPADIEDIVPKISRFANTQNRLNDADFFSGHPFHLEMEKISRRLSAPQKAGAFSASKWFYERARGQYKDKLAYAAAVARNRFLAEFPKDQVIVKTDLAKAELTFECEPHVVSQGAQKCFLSFADRIGKAWYANPSHFHETYFKDAVARIILFRWTDSMISKSDWYKEDRGYKANIVTYTVAWLVNFLQESEKAQIDLQQIWRNQDVSDELKEALSRCARDVAVTIKATPPQMKNISEYCKRQACWAAVSNLEIGLGVDLKRSTVDREEAGQREREARAGKRLDDEVEFDVLLVSLIPHVSEIKRLAESRGLLSPRSSAGLLKMAAAKLNFTKGEKNALMHLFNKLTEDGFTLPGSDA